MSVRDWVNQHSAIVTVAALLVLIGGLALFVMSGRGNEVPKQKYFWDLRNEALLVLPHDRVPPVKLDSGAEAVAAIVYCCGECGDGALEIAWLEKYPETVRQNLVSNDEAGGDAQSRRRQALSDPSAFEPGRAKLIRRKDDAKWVRAQSVAGARILASLNHACGEGVKYRFCAPD